MAASSVEVDLLGEPRLKNGLTYYPGVRTDKGSVLLGNIVRLQLRRPRTRREDPNGRALLFWCRRGRGAVTLLC